MTRQLLKIAQTVVSLTVYCLRWTPARLEKFFFKAVSRIVHPSIAGRIFKDAFCSHLKARGIFVEVEYLQTIENVPVKLSLDVADYIQRRFLTDGFPDFMPMLLRFCDKETVFFDIGANVGIVSLGVATVVPSSQIFAFEPVTKTFGQLEENVRRNHPKINCHHVALSDQVGKVSMLTVAHDSGSASVDHDYLKQRLESNYIRTNSQTETCQTQRFDTFLSNSKQNVLHLKKKVAIKIDVEGHEIAVLNGMKLFLDTIRLEILVICETNWKNLDTVRAKFENLGFDLLGPSEAILVNGTLYGSAKDLIFHRR